ncbi:MAG: FAD-dependent oxidoreductase [Flavobacteriaceae bacterium]
MSQYNSRRDFLKKNPKATAFAKFAKGAAFEALAKATKQQKQVTDHAIKLSANQLKDKKVIVIGSGVGGLTAAYEILAQNSGAQVTVLEALNRTGGRCLSLRTGDTLTEDTNSNLFESEPSETQVVRFKRPVGDAEPYLNAGPGRIPSSHKRLLAYLKKFSVDIEVYVMNSESNLVQKDTSFGGDPMVYRRLDHNTRGWLAQMVFHNATKLLINMGINNKVLKTRVEELQDLMVSFGELDADGNYEVSAGTEGFEDGKSRAGYTILPGVDAGEVADKISLDELLESEFWKGTKFYQPVDFLWQPTLFQPVGGMDHVQHAFAQQVASLGGDIHLNSPVKTIDWDEQSKKFKISVSQVGTEETKDYEADYCICNLAMPFLREILSEKLLNDGSTGLDNEFKEALRAVFTAEFHPTEAPGYEPREDGYIPKFLASTTKVGWQADRNLWQGSPIKDDLSVEDSEVGVVPIFGGISWTDNDIQQIWYPSSAYQDEKGVLTGAYNFDKIASEWGEMSVQERLDKAQEDAAKFNQKFADGLKDGLAIAWQNMPHIKGGWAYWQAVGDAEYATEQFNTIAQGSRVNGNRGERTLTNFFIVGDQISSLPGWQEGAIASAINAITLMAKPDALIRPLKYLPDTRLMVEGI